ncbi:hypothetical protein SAMN05444004_11415 [Jannaschia faecimaris]|uniref:Uncharacterized protein n=1 Tax=Jannaschia faecimaris TaxID=1244108 RepID=A0A1H3SWZ4_9RHOB|nr:hypothetical protein [Jannaschia faecimaris]SDZ42290.1 hypothetical protein SAMN05444004_11415 [Jannaschia faecimaris]
MIRALALIVCIAAPAAAQSYGVPPALVPCTDRHLDPARYRADLEAQGWRLVPAMNRAAQLTLLNDTFLALVAGNDGPRADRLERGRKLWARMGETQLLFTASDGAQALMVSGGFTPDGAAQLRCWMAFADGTRMDDVYAQLLTDANGTPEPGETQVITLTQTPEAGDETLSFYLTRPTPGMDTPATHAGIATLLTLSPEIAQ